MESIQPSEFLQPKFEEAAKKLIADGSEMLEIPGTPFFVAREVPDDAMRISEKEFDGVKIYLCQEK